MGDSVRRTKSNDRFPACQPIWCCTLPTCVPRLAEAYRDAGWTGVPVPSSHALVVAAIESVVGSRLLTELAR